MVSRGSNAKLELPSAPTLTLSSFVQWARMLPRNSPSVTALPESGWDMLSDQWPMKRPAFNQEQLKSPTDDNKNEREDKKKGPPMAPERAEEGDF